MARNPKGKGKKKAKKPPTATGEAKMETDKPVGQPSVWRPGVDGMDEGEVLQYDPTAYDCLHPFSLDWPALSFDIIRDQLGAPRSAFPHSMLLVAGSQATSAKANTLTLLRLDNLGQGKHGKHAKDGSDSDSDGMSDDDDDDEALEQQEGGPPRLHYRRVAHHGCVNRVRGMPQQPGVVASWGDGGQVQVWDLAAQLAELEAEKEPRPAAKNRPLQMAPRHLYSHPTEGYALDWSPVARGFLASGDNRHKVHVWTPAEAKWSVSGAYKGHEGPVEEIQWSPTEATVFATSSVDKTIRIWDTREKSRPMLTVPAHDSDVNVMSWNRLATHMLASGDDNGVLRCWDLRAFKEGGHVANFSYHRGPISSVEWSPHESSTLATTSRDNQLAVWDLAVERDPEEEAALAAEGNAEVPDDLPAQLLFLHAGQYDMKEAHWHPQIPGMLVSTAEDGFNVFKPANIGDLPG